MRVIVTGCRDWMWPDLVEKELEQLWGDLDCYEALIVVHGDCPTGADRFAKEWVEKKVQQMRREGSKANPPEEEPHPYKRELGKRGGPVRNQEMAEDGGHLCLAFHDGIGDGTRNMMTEATLHRIRVVVIPAPHPIPRTRRNT
jgi:hypothetical protein